MSSRPLAIVTTRLPPQICGVGTYSWRLDKAWPRSDVRRVFLVCDGAEASRTELRSAEIIEHRCGSEALLDELRQLGDCDVLVHYAARAYQRYGVPRWLCRALERWKSGQLSGRLTIMFHEMPSTMTVTSRHFLPNFLNARIVRRLAKIADAVITNTSEQAQHLAKLSQRSDIHVVPVGTNIEPSDSPTQARHRSEFLLFGLPFGRLQTLQRFEKSMREWIKCGALTRLHVIGPRDDRFSIEEDKLIAQMNAATLTTVHGRLSDGAVSTILSEVAFALTNLTVNTWSKSSVFMACAAHGCAVVAPIMSDTTPLQFVVGSDEVATMTDTERERRITSLREWFNANASWPIIARRIEKLVASETTGTAT